MTDADIMRILTSPEGYSGQNLNLPPRLKANAQNLCFAYNATGPDEGARRAELLGSLRGTCHPYKSSI